MAAPDFSSFGTLVEATHRSCPTSRSSSRANRARARPAQRMQVKDDGRGEPMNVLRYDLCDGRYVFHLLELGEKIGKANIYRDRFAGSRHAWRIDYLGLNKDKRGIGKGGPALNAVVAEIHLLDPMATYITAEALGKNILRLLVTRLGKPIVLSSSGKTLTLNDAWELLPDTAHEHANGAVSGPRVFLAFNASNSTDRYQIKN